MENPSNPDSLKGQFLMSMPGLADPNFARTVTCMCEHTAEGAVGIVINRQHEGLAAKRIFEELNLEYTQRSAQLPIHIGGPVHANEIFILHGPPFRWEGCLPITETLAMSNTMDLLRAIARDEGPISAVIALGCAGWGPAQLEAEIRENAWLTGPVVEEIIFETAIESRWEAAMQGIGIDPALLSDAAGHA